MSTKSLLATTMLLPFMTGTAFSMQSGDLSSALDKLDKSKVQCYCVCEFSGRSQLAAGIQMAKMFEQELAENEEKDSVVLAGSFQGFIGISSGALLAAPFALGQSAGNVEGVNANLTSKLIMPKGVSGCLGCLGTTTKIASYFLNGSESDYDDGPAKLQNNYDAFVLNSRSTTEISNITAGTDADLKAPLTILSTSISSDFAEQTIAAIKETDAATKKNATKIAFDTLLDAAKVVTSTVINVAGEKIDKSAAEKALDIMTKVDEGAEKLNSALDNTVFKQNLVQNLGAPSAETPILVINLKSKTGSGSAIKTSLTQDIEDNFVKLTYTTELPLSMYPSKKLTFETLKPMIESSVTNCMQSIRLDSAKSTDIVSDFLTEAKLAKKAMISQ